MTGARETLESLRERFTDSLYRDLIWAVRDLDQRVANYERLRDWYGRLPLARLN